MLLRQFRCHFRSLSKVSTQCVRRNIAGVDSIKQLRSLSVLHKLTPFPNGCSVHTRCFSQDINNQNDSALSDIQYEEIVEETLESMSEYLDELADMPNCSEEYDVAYSNGVLTVKFGPEAGTYVINKQTPNKQIWLSSPTSGPKRYDYVDGKWIYKHDGVSLHDLLTTEIRLILGSEIDFTNCSYSGKGNHR